MTTNFESTIRAFGRSQIPSAGLVPARAGALVGGADAALAADRASPWDALRGLRAGAIRALETLFEWQERARERNHLETLSDYHLKDMGISRADVVRETSKPFWRR